MLNKLRPNRFKDLHVLITKDDEGDLDIRGYALSQKDGDLYCVENNIKERFIKLTVTPFYKSYLVSQYPYLKCTTEK